MSGFFARSGALLIAAALLFVALRIHRTQKGKKAGVIIALLAGLAFLVTIVGEWMGNVAAIGGALGAAGLIVAAGIIIADWAMDKRPDKPAFWAMFALPALLVFGVVQIPAVGEQLGDGGAQVADQMSQVGK